MKASLNWPGAGDDSTSKPHGLRKCYFLACLSIFLFLSDLFNRFSFYAKQNSNREYSTDFCLFNLFFFLRKQKFGPILHYWFFIFLLFFWLLMSSVPLTPVLLVLQEINNSHTQFCRPYDPPPCTLSLFFFFSNFLISYKSFAFFFFNSWSKSIYVFISTNNNNFVIDNIQSLE